MKNKWKISIATALAAITTVGICANINANAEDADVIKFSSEIVALTPRGGDMVSVVHSGMHSSLITVVISKIWNWLEEKRKKTKSRFGALFKRAVSITMQV